MCCGLLRPFLSSLPTQPHQTGSCMGFIELFNTEERTIVFRGCVGNLCKSLEDIIVLESVLTLGVFFFFTPVETTMFWVRNWTSQPFIHYVSLLLASFHTLTLSQVVGKLTDLKQQAPVTVNAVKISITTVSNPICVLIFRLNTNMWIHHLNQITLSCSWGTNTLPVIITSTDQVKLSGVKYCTTLFANIVSQEIMSVDITSLPPEVHKPAHHW